MTENADNILVVDDTPANLRLLSGILTEHDYKVRMAPNGKLALLNAQADPPDLILLDIKMPEMDGYEVCKQLKADPRTRDIPVIFLSALDQTDDKVRAFTSGGVDYITKPFQVEEVLARVKTHLDLYSYQRQLMTLNSKLHKLAITDHLTDLYNRRYFFEAAMKELNRAKRYHKKFSLMLIDIDDFKAINDKYGHLEGDRVLQITAKSIQQYTRNTDVAGRFGGDEFAVLVSETDNQESEVLAERLSHTFSTLLKEMEGLAETITLSIGIAGFDDTDPDTTIDTIFEQADQALYEAKETGKNSIKIWKMKE